MPKTKTHQTFTVTEDFLNSLHACSGSIRRLTEIGMLPCVISTDPDENLEIALELTQTDNDDGATTACSGWVAWLASACSVADATDAVSARGRSSGHGDGRILKQNTERYACNSSCCIGNGGEYDPTIVAQMLAMIADKKLTAKGK